MIESGLFLFFLIPGLLAYCALYGLFHSGKAIAPEPPGVNSVEAVTVILLCSVTVHAAAGALIFVNGLVCHAGFCPISAPNAWLDPYSVAFRSLKDAQAPGRTLGMLFGVSLLQGIAAYALVRAWLRSLALRDALPAWIYGWATDIANAADNADTLVVAYVSTTHEIGGRIVLYGGLLYDMALRNDGSIARLTLWDCERYLADFTTNAGEPTINEASSSFPFMMIEASQIRNVVFRIVPA